MTRIFSLFTKLYLTSWAVLLIFSFGMITGAAVFQMALVGYLKSKGVEL